MVVGVLGDNIKMQKISNLHQIINKYMNKVPIFFYFLCKIPIFSYFLSLRIPIFLSFILLDALKMLFVLWNVNQIIAAKFLKEV